jgi:hypothetical protein
MAERMPSKRLRSEPRQANPRRLYRGLPAAMRNFFKKPALIESNWRYI